MEIEARLHRLGLTNGQTKIYLFLLQTNEARIQDIAHRTKIPRSTVYEHLRGLLDKGLVEEIIYDTHKTLRAYPLHTLRNSVDEQIIELKKHLKDIEQLDKELTIPNPSLRHPDISLRYYKDKAGARQVYWNTLRSTSNVYVMSDWGRSRYIGQRFYERFVQESRSRNIHEHVLINLTTATLASIKNFNYPGSSLSRTPIDNIRVIDEKILSIRGDTLMYNTTYAQVYLKIRRIHGFEIEGQDFTRMQRSLFEILWEQAQPVNELL